MAFHPATALLAPAPVPEGVVPEECNEVWADLLLKAVLFKMTEAAPPHEHPCLSVRRGVIVTIRSSDGQLRGCVGTTLPVAQNIVEETPRLARAAAFCDGRLPPVTAEASAVPSNAIDSSCRSPPWRNRLPFRWPSLVTTP